MHTRGSRKAHKEKGRKKFQRTLTSFTCIAHVEKKYKNNKIINEQPALRCQPAFGSHSQMLTNKLFFFVFLRKPLVCLSCAWWKRYFLTHFQVFLIVFDHVNACASMYLLVEIHNSHLWGCSWIHPSRAGKCDPWIQPRTYKQI